MPTIAEQLTQLASDRDDLVDNLETKGITGLTGNETITELVPKVLDISGGGGVDIHDYFDTTYSTETTGGQSYAYGYRLIKRYPTITIDDNFSSCYNMFSNNINLIEQPTVIGTGHCTSFTGMFSGCSKLKTITSFDVSAGTSFTYMFRGCTNLEDFPVFNPRSTSSLGNMLVNCTKLTTTSLDNVLQTCINATGITNANNKTLMSVFGSSMSSYYPASTIQSLPHYQDFISAGWSIGW